MFVLIVITDKSSAKGKQESPLSTTMRQSDSNTPALLGGRVHLLAAFTPSLSFLISIRSHCPHTSGTWTEHCPALFRLFLISMSLEKISNQRCDTSVMPTKRNPMEVTHLRRNCQNTARRLTHHGWIEEDKNSRS